MIIYWYHDSYSSKTYLHYIVDSLGCGIISLLSLDNSLSQFSINLLLNLNQFFKLLFN